MQNKLKERREELNMTQEQLSEKAQISRQTISSIENNLLENIESKTMFSLAEALSCNISDIFFKRDVKHTQQNLKEKT